MSNYPSRRPDTGTSAPKRVPRVPSPPVKKAEPKPQIRELETKQPFVEDVGRKFSKRAMVAVVVVSLAVLGFLVGRISFNELDVQYSKKQTELLDVKADNDRLQVICEASQSREKVEKYAVEVLHMQPIQDYQRKSITLKNEEEVVTLLPVRQKTLFNKVGEFFSK
ncbi:MAG: hypothetical protein LBS74_10785 [Oscillospiraceae bacterium]|jgi:hypothetical protein|nr:hypothetical protein [Oscillospiraceae bacterium]